MEETNEISQNLKQKVYDYYMGYIKDKFNYLEEDQEQEISDTIMQLLDTKIAEQNSIIYKDEIIPILRTAMLKDDDDRFIRMTIADRIDETFPEIATVTIEQGKAVHVQELKKELFEPDEENAYYLYVSNEFYDANIPEIEKAIKVCERNISSKDLESFDEQFSKDATIKGYELDSAKEYENARRQINEKQKKFDAVKKKMIYDYGRKYQEIMDRPISDDEKQALLAQLLAETKSYDDKTNSAGIQLQEELEQLNRSFANRAKSSDDIMKEMKKMNLFDRDRYIRERKGDSNPQLADLYAKRDELNTYRTQHEQPVYEVKQNPFASIITTIARSIRGEKPQLLLEYHPERDIPTGVDSIIAPHQEGIDENLIQTLAHIYGEQANKVDSYFFGEEKQPTIDTTEFEAHLVKYFRAHYKDLMEDGYNHFLSDFAEMPDKYEKYNKEGELIRIAKQYGIDPQKFHCFGYKLSIRDGLIYEEEGVLDELKQVYYATDEGINSIIEDLYGKALYEDHTADSGFRIKNARKLKNGFVEYAKQHGIKIKNEYALENIQANQDKVNAVSKYVNELVNSELASGQEGYKPVDYTEIISQDIAENYSTIFNLNSYSFSNLSSVKKIMGDKYLSDTHLSIREDSILKNEEYSPRIVYATPEYCAREYANIMDKIHTLKTTTNPFLEGYFNLIETNAMKTALRTYIQENDIDIDTSVEQVPINQERIDMIADAFVEQYGEKARDPKTFRSSITKKLTENWSEIMTEMGVVQVRDMFEDELQQNTFVDEELYVNDDFIYLGDFDNYHAKCIYATPEVLKETIAKLDETISTRDSIMSNREKKARNALTQYAKDNDIKLDIPNLASITLQQEERKRAESRMFDSLFTDSLPDDPTAREKIELNDTVMDLMFKMSEGNPGAITAMAKLINDDPGSFMLLLGLDDMNIRGSQIWQVYKYYCEEDAEKFKKVIQDRDADMVQYLNELNAAEGHEKAVSGGASFDRSKKPDLYRFDAEEVELYRQAKEERLQKAREEKEQQKTQPKQKRYIAKRKARENKLKAYKDALIQKGKDIIERKRNNKGQDLNDDNEER